MAMKRSKRVKFACPVFDGPSSEEIRNLLERLSHVTFALIVFRVLKLRVLKHVSEFHDYLINLSLLHIFTAIAALSV